MRIWVALLAVSVWFGAGRNADAVSHGGAGAETGMTAGNIAQQRIQPFIPPLPNKSSIAPLRNNPTLIAPERSIVGPNRPDFERREGFRDENATARARRGDFGFLPRFSDSTIGPVGPLDDSGLGFERGDARSFGASAGRREEGQRNFVPHLSEFTVGPVGRLGGNSPRDQAPSPSFRIVQRGSILCVVGE